MFSLTWKLVFLAPRTDKTLANLCILGTVLTKYTNTLLYVWTLIQGSKRYGAFSWFLPDTEEKLIDMKQCILILNMKLLYILTLNLMTYGVFAAVFSWISVSDKCLHLLSYFGISPCFMASFLIKFRRSLVQKHLYAAPFWTKERAPEVYYC